MSDPVNFDFDEYIRQSEPEKQQKGYIWQTAIGLQDVDGLKPSEYLIETAKKNIDGDITLKEANELIHSYYESKTARIDAENRTEEADKVSARIAQILSEDAFVFSPEQFIAIHRRLFEGIYKFAGNIRDYNISKKEWVLKGKSVVYAGSDMIRDTLNYDFDAERHFNYSGLGIDKSIRHITEFISNLWQIHPFGEGNTRTIAVFTMKYLQSFGFEVKNDMFKNHSWYFRNALVRANYNNYPKGISATNVYLVRFLRNLLLGEENVLRNRDLLITSVQSASSPVPKCQNDTLDCTLEELAIVKILRENGKAKQEEIASQIGKSLRTVKRIMAGLIEKKVIVRENGRRNGVWIVKKEL